MRGDRCTVVKGCSRTVVPSKHGPTAQHGMLTACSNCVKVHYPLLSLLRVSVTPDLTLDCSVLFHNSRELRVDLMGARGGHATGVLGHAIGAAVVRHEPKQEGFVAAESGSGAAA